jgi:hypothetical protein
MPQLRRCRPQLLATAAVTAALSTSAVSAAAQAASAPPTPLLPQQSIAINPLAIPFGVFSAEYEAALPSPGFTFGVGGTYYSSGSDRDAWAEAKGMYYPGEIPFRGFSVGLTAGVHSSRGNTSDCSFITGCQTGRKTQTAPTLGVLVSYDWLIGRQERFRVGLGAGAKRILKNVKSGDPLPQVFPDGRFVIGLVF